jgi:hypothetical protein
MSEARNPVDLSLGQIVRQQVRESSLSPAQRYERLRESIAAAYQWTPEQFVRRGLRYEEGKVKYLGTPQDFFAPGFNLVLAALEDADDGVEYMMRLIDKTAPELAEGQCPRVGTPKAEVVSYLFTIMKAFAEVASCIEVLPPMLRQLELGTGVETDDGAADAGGAV